MENIENKKEKLWDIINKNYRDKVKYDTAHPPSTPIPSFIPSSISSVSHPRGGIAIFNMLYTPQDNGVNCRYLFAGYRSVEYDTYLKYVPYHQLLNEMYDPEVMYMIGICIPYIDEEGKNVTAVEIKIFDYSTDKEIVPKIDTPAKNETNLNNLRKRK